jgi:hypothetical protein
LVFLQRERERETVRTELVFLQREREIERQYGLNWCFYRERERERETVRTELVLLGLYVAELSNWQLLSLSELSQQACAFVRL